MQTGAEEAKRKGKTPKEEISCKSNLGHMIKSRMTVIYADFAAMGRYQEGITCISSAGAFTSAVFARKTSY